MVKGVRELGMEACVTLGMLSQSQADRLADAESGDIAHHAREALERMGEELAREHPVEADFVMPVPDKLAQVDQEVAGVARLVDQRVRRAGVERPGADPRRGSRGVDPREQDSGDCGGHVALLCGREGHDGLTRSVGDDYGGPVEQGTPEGGVRRCCTAGDGDGLPGTGSRRHDPRAHEVQRCSGSGERAPFVLDRQGPATAADLRPVPRRPAVERLEE